MCRQAPDRGDIVLSWLTKIAVVFAVLGVLFFDAVSVGVTVTTLSDEGSYAAREASEAWQETANLQAAYDAAVKVAFEANPQNSIDTATFLIDEDDTVHLTISREAPTLLLYRWGRTAKWTKIERETTGRSVA